MNFNLTDEGRLDLSTCLMQRNYDMFAVYDIAQKYYYAELCSLTAWDGLKIVGMNNEKHMHHLICQHGKGRGEINKLLDLDIKRIECLPVLKAAVTGNLPVEIYKQTQNKKEDKVQVVIEGVNVNYVVVLGCVEDAYRIRSAYPANETYIEKIKRTGLLVETIAQT